MNIYYDYQILYSQKYGGISRYYYDLIQEMDKRHPVETEIHCKYNVNRYFAGIGDIELGEGFLNVKSSIIRRPLRFYGHKINQNITKRCAKRADIVHLTYYNPYALKLKGVKKVVTVYDMIEEVMRKDSHLDFLIEYKRKCIYGADHIIAISESTKRDILRLYPDAGENKISVIYIASSLDVNKQQKMKLPERYILFVGRREGYKNFNTFFSAIYSILKEDRSLHLICIGGGAFSEDEVRMMDEIQDRVLQINADDAVLTAVYSNALCFVFPSQYEGFGIPTLEAFSCDCPAVISNTSSMPEVGGDAVLYFDPNDQEEIKRQVERIVYDEALRTDLVNKGKERLKAFSWNQIAERTIDCYKRVLNNGK